MKKHTIIVSIAFLAVISIFFVSTGLVFEKQEPVRHVVVFKYKEGATAEQIQTVTDAFRQLQHNIPGILSFEYGVNMSPEGKNQGFTHVYLLTFEDAAARDAYLPHPEHKKFGEVLRASGIFEDAFVVDYVPQE